VRSHWRSTGLFFPDRNSFATLESLFFRHPAVCRRRPSYIVDSRALPLFLSGTRRFLFSFRFQVDCVSPSDRSGLWQEPLPFPIFWCVALTSSRAAGAARVVFRPCTGAPLFTSLTVCESMVRFRTTGVARIVCDLFLPHSLCEPRFSLLSLLSPVGDT
jgi:hypothetical protein